jgi:hypothetical protein
MWKWKNLMHPSILFATYRNLIQKYEEFRNLASRKLKKNTLFHIVLKYLRACRISPGKKPIEHHYNENLSES